MRYREQASSPLMSRRTEAVRYTAVHKRAAFSLLLLTAITSCGRSGPVMSHSASAREDIIARLPQKDVQPFIAALRSGMPDLTGNINISEWRDYGGTSRADANVYIAAIDDAKQKATAIARHVNAKLGAIESITEYDGPVGAAPAPGATQLKGSSVMVRSDAPIALAVTYTLSSAGSISVFGLADAAAHGAPQGVDVSVSVNAPSIAEAWNRAGGVESYVRQVGRKFGLTGSAISINNTGLDRY